MTQDWREHAACLGVDADIFFPREATRRFTRHDYDEALKFCARCPVRKPCLEVGVETSFADGVWGGTTPSDRRKIRKQRRSLKVVPEPSADVEPKAAPEALPPSEPVGVGIDVDVHDLTEPESTVTRGELLRFRKAVPWTA